MMGTVADPGRLEHRQVPEIVLEPPSLVLEQRAVNC